MTSRTRTTITIHTRQRIVVRPLHETVITWCERCAEDVLMVMPEKAADILETTQQVLGELLEKDSVHAIETASGSSLICCNSLVAASAVYEIQIEGDQTNEGTNNNHE